MDAGKILKAPVVIQQLEAVRPLSVLHQVFAAGGSRNVVGTVGHGAQVQGMQIFVVGGYDHG